MIPHTFTLQVWIRPAGPGTIFSVQTSAPAEPGAENFLNLGLSESALSFVYTHNLQAEVDATATNDWPRDNWALINIVALWFEPNYQIRFFINGNRIITENHSVTRPIVDDPSWEHLIGTEISWAGADFQKGQFYVGFIYELCIYVVEEAGVTLFEVDPCPEGDFCTSCPIIPGPFKCLIDCEYD